MKMTKTQKTARKNTKAVIEIVRMTQHIMERPDLYEFPITSTKVAGKFFQREIGLDAQEVMIMICLDTKSNITAVHRVFTGSINSSVAHPREIFRTAIMNNASRIMVAHNHPSGNTQPSQPDITFTERLKEAGEIVGIELLDHIIVGPREGTYTSLREEGVI